jgi:hypothetical protein
MLVVNSIKGPVLFDQSGGQPVEATRPPALGRVQSVASDGRRAGGTPGHRGQGAGRRLAAVAYRGTGLVRLPTPNHTHIIEDSMYDLVWWRVIVELVVDPSIWPDVNRDCPAHTAAA